MGKAVLGFAVGISAVDPVGHANSARYVEWLLDCFPFESYTARSLNHLQLNFSTEVRPGEHLIIAELEYEKERKGEGGSDSPGALTGAKGGT